MENEKLTYINSRGERLELGVDSVYHCNISKDVEGISGVTSVIYSTNSSNLLRVVQEQQETIEKQSRLIADLIATLESWEQTAGYDGAELKERAENLQLRERQDL